MKLDQLRPRARKVLRRSDLKEGMEVLANYNMQEPKKRGIWVRGVVEKVTRKEVVCTLYVGVDLTPVPDCKLSFPDETMRLEGPVKPADRSEEVEREMNTPVERKNPPKCEVCQDNERKKCKECGCYKCGGKNNPEGCQSIVISGGYEDNVDNGEEFTYTGSGGRDLSGNKRTAEQSFDQTLDKVNGAIARNCYAEFDAVKGADAKEDWQKGKEIRVVRGKSKKKKHENKYAPEEGNR